MKKKEILNQNKKTQYKLGKQFTQRIFFARIILCIFLFFIFDKSHFLLSISLKTIIYFLIFSANTLLEIPSNYYYTIKSTSYPNKDEVVREGLSIFLNNTSKLIIGSIFYICIGNIFLGIIYRGLSMIDTVIDDNGDDYVFFKAYVNKILHVLNFIPNKIFNFLVLIILLFKNLNPKIAAKIFFLYKNKKISSNNEILSLMFLNIFHDTKTSSVSENNLLITKDIILLVIILFFIILLLIKILLIYFFNTYLYYHFSLLFLINTLNL